MATPGFEWQDYLVFSIMLAISSVIGLYFGITSRRKKTACAEEMLTGSGNLPILPVALSLGASFTSATTILGVPAEVYTRGGEQWLWILGIIPAFIVVGIFVVPVFHRLKLTNAYEYLEIRYNKAIRYVGSLAFCTIILLYMAAVLYAPAVALSQVTGIPREVSIVIMGVVCTLYTCIGGIRAVVWTDAFQLLVIWAGLVALMFKGASDVGGWDKVWELADKGDRLPRFEMNPSPFIRHTFWTFLLGGGTNMMCVYGGYQINLQRYSSVRSLRGAQTALLLNLPIWVCYICLLCLLGTVMYAYNSCDPLSSKVVSSPDQLIPLFVLDTMGSMPGLPGLFVASIFSASVSTLSSGINSLAAVTLEDLIKPCMTRWKKCPPSSKLLTTATMVLVVVFGMVTIGMAYVIGTVGKTAFMISFSVFGMIGGPLLGLILNGIFCPFVNTIGAGSGFFVSILATFYYGIYPIANPPPPINLPVRQDTCDVIDDAMTSFNMTTTTTTFFNASTAIPTAPLGQDTDLGHPYLSYLHLSTVALVLSFAVSAVVSLLTGGNKDRHIDERTYYHYSWCSTKQRSSSIALSGVKGNKYDMASDNPKSSPNNVGTFHFASNDSCAVQTGGGGTNGTTRLSA